MTLADDKLLPYQVAPAHELAAVLSTRRVAVDMSDTGLGKTYIALAVAQAIGASAILVVCPKAVKPTWKRVAAHFGIEKKVHPETYDILRRGGTYWFEKTSYLYRGKPKHDYKYTGAANELVIFDEAHNCSGRTTQNAELLIACRRQGVRTLLLSATLAENPLQMRAIGYALGLFELSDYWDWARKHDVVITTNMGPQWYAGIERRGGIMAKIRAQVLPCKGIRLRKADLAHLFPTNIVTADTYEMPEAAKIKAVYAEMEKEMGTVSRNREQDRAREEERELEFEKEHERWEALSEKEQEKTPEPEHKTAKSAIAGARFRQEIELLKVPTFLQLAADAVAEGNRVALFVNFDATIEAIAARAEGISIVRGGQTELVREQNLADFNDGRSTLIVLNAAAGGVGISLHDTQGGAPRVALISPLYSAKQLLQVLGRCPRAGGKTPVVQKIIYAAQTVEEEACKAVRAKLHCLQALNDGDLSGDLPFEMAA